MVNSSVARYQNLFNHIQNWSVYFTRKFKKAFESIVFITKGNKLQFIVPSKALYLVFKEIFVTDFYSIDKLVAALPPNPVVIDIGANAGYFNIILFSKINEGTVYAYEPIPSNYELFKKNILLNPVLQNKIHLFNKAVTGTPKDHIELFLEAATDNSVIASVYADFDTQNHHTLQVPAISLEQIINENKLQYIDLIKVDCEGSEYPVIYETPAYIWEKVKMLVIEVHKLDENLRNEKSLQRFLQEKGYFVTVETAHTNCYSLTAIKNQRK